MVAGLLDAGNYCAANHWLKSVKAAGTLDADAVAAKMKATPVNDFYNSNVQIREDGRVMHVMYLWQVKTPAESKGDWDFYKILKTLKGEEAFGKLAEATDDATALKYYAAAHQRLVDNPPWLFIVHDLNPRAFSKKVKGFVSPQSWFVDLTLVSLE